MDYSVSAVLPCPPFAHPPSRSTLPALCRTLALVQVPGGTRERSDRRERSRRAGFPSMIYLPPKLPADSMALPAGQVCNPLPSYPPNHRSDLSLRACEAGVAISSPHQLTALAEGVLFLRDIIIPGKAGFGFFCSQAESMPTRQQVI